MMGALSKTALDWDSLTSAIFALLDWVDVWIQKHCEHWPELRSNPVELELHPVPPGRSGEHMQATVDCGGCTNLTSKARLRLTPNMGIVGQGLTHKHLPQTTATPWGLRWTKKLDCPDVRMVRFLSAKRKHTWTCWQTPTQRSQQSRKRVAKVATSI